MNIQFTTKSQEALSAAAMNASTAGNPQIEPAHLLKALMDQRESVAVAVLKAANIDPDAVSTRASSQIAALPKVSGSSVAEAQLSRAGVAVISAAQTWAQNNHAQFVSTEHLLLGLAADTSDTGQGLRDSGATAEALSAAMKSVRGDTKVTSKDPEGTFQSL
ncbi:MAG: ATP-dependent chaperone ClpB, partial [Yaniella sp.]|nr:ATP-dependent chaperone ClpB [Yaniella sp.]